MMYILDLIGTAVFAITGALAAGRKRMDVFGVVVIGCVTAMGGGTLRDVILGIHPVFWVTDSMYLLVAVMASTGTFVMVRRWHVPMRTLVYADAAGLAIFTVIGFQQGYAVAGSYTIAIVMGVITGVVGGMIRDVLSGEIPLILRSEIYASASLSGAILLAVLLYFQISASLAVMLSVLMILTIRIAALRRNVSLPHFQFGEEKEGN